MRGLSTSIEAGRRPRQVPSSQKRASASSLSKKASPYGGLGVFFDSQLRLKEHIKRAASRALTVAKALKALGSTHKGMAPHLMRQAAMACVYGTAAFAAETWWQGPEAKGYTGPIKALDRAFATAARAIAPAYATVPIAALFREAGIHRAKPFLESARRKAAARLFRLDIDHPLAQRIFKPLTISTRLTRLAALAPPATTRADPLAYAPWQLHNKADLAAEARGPFLPAGPKDLIAYTSGALEAKTEAAEAAAGTGCALYRQGQEVATSSLPYPPTASPLGPCNASDSRSAISSGAPNGARRLPTSYRCQ